VTGLADVLRAIGSVGRVERQCPHLFRVRVRVRARARARARVWARVRVSLG